MLRLNDDIIRLIETNTPRILKTTVLPWIKLYLEKRIVITNIIAYSYSLVKIDIYI